MCLLGGDSQTGISHSKVAIVHAYTIISSSVIFAVVDCDSLQSPLNGEVALTVTTFGSTANYSCIGGYTLNGIPQRVCQADGQWNSSEPACSKL